MEGDCGAAVVDQETGGFYGHIVRGCPGTQLAYIVAASEIMQDIQVKFGRSVKIVTADSLRNTEIVSDDPHVRRVFAPGREYDTNSSIGNTDKYSSAWDTKYTFGYLEDRYQSIYTPWLYTSIREQHFSDDSLDAVLPADLSNELESSGLEYPGDIVEQFDQERWAFCPAKIEDMLDHTRAFYGGQWILPFCKKEHINQGGTARVDRVLVQQDLVPQELKNRLEGCEFTDNEFGSCYQLAIRSFRAEAQTIFQTEISNFCGIKSLPGVVRYFGWYKMEEFDDDKILLEYGDLDLEEYLALRYPPVLNEEIIKFWESLFSIAATLDHIHNYMYKRVDGVTATFDGSKPNHQGRDPMPELIGITQTYGAPECDPGRLRRGTRTRHTQVIDTWSLGCVLSSVATWVVLGSFAYEQYRDVRRLAIADLLAGDKSNPGLGASKVNGCFHDGRHVLPAVKSWHKYLVASMRKSDTITGDVLRLVEDQMLLSDPEDRLPPAAVATGLQDIVILARARHAEALRRQETPDIPAETLKALLTLDDTTPPDVGLEARLCEPLADHYATVLEPRTRPWTTRIKKPERLEQMVVPARIAGRQEVLNKALSQQGDSYSRISVVFENPTMRATKPSAAPEWLELPERQTESAQLPKLLVTTSIVNQPTVSTAIGTLRQPTRHISSPSHTMFSAPHGYPRQVIRPQHLSNLSLDDDFDDYPIANLHRQLTKVWTKNQSFFRVLRNKIPADKRLRDFVQDRDIMSRSHLFTPLLRTNGWTFGQKFLVDNGSSMRAHWEQAKLILETLAMKVGPLDEDGLDLVFPLRQGYLGRTVKGFEMLPRFRTAMDKAQPPEYGRFLHTPMAHALSSILSEYQNNRSKKLTVFILTTGKWEDAEDIESLVVDNLRKMSVFGPDFFTERRCTLQFISFGDDKQGLQHLNNLDYTLTERYGFP
ncbi:hypothetical protein V8F33_009184 [Rhypophila sp. PSN 637]